MKKIIFLGAIGMFIWNGCGGMQIPKLDDTEALNKISYKQFAEGSFMSETKENLYAGSMIANTSDGNLKDEFGSLCRAKGGSFEWISRGLYNTKEIYYPEYVQTPHKNSYSSVGGSNGICKDKETNDIKFIYFQSKAQPLQTKPSRSYYWLTLETSPNRIEQYKSFLSEQTIKAENAQLQKAERMLRVAQIKAEEEKLKGEKLLKEQNIIKALKNRSGQIVFTFMPTYTAFNYYNKDECSNLCSKNDLLSTGYYNLQDAMNDGWKFVSKLDDTAVTINQNCKCNGSNYLLQK